MDLKHEDIPADLKPFFVACFILFFGICDRCWREEDFESEWPQFSDAYWLDEARALRDAGWIVEAPLVTPFIHNC
jgi:hypothetical protein